MNGSEIRRRDVLVSVSGGCVALAGCADAGSADPASGTVTDLPSGYGSAYGREYGVE